MRIFLSFSFSTPVIAIASRPLGGHVSYHYSIPR
jgi:hypothetical protein